MTRKAREFLHANAASPVVNFSADKAGTYFRLADGQRFTLTARDYAALPALPQLVRLAAAG